MKRRSPSTWLGRRKARERKRDQRLMREGKLRPEEVSIAAALRIDRSCRFTVPEFNGPDEDGFYR